MREGDPRLRIVGALHPFGQSIGITTSGLLLPFKMGPLSTTTVAIIFYERLSLLSSKFLFIHFVLLIDIPATSISITTITTNQPPEFLYLL